MGIDEYRRFNFESSCAEIAGRIMNVSKVNFSIARISYFLNNHICLVVLQRRVSGHRALLTDRHVSSRADA